VTARERPPYASPAAFRRALTDKLRTIAHPRGPWALAELQRQIAYDRLLVRLYRLDNGWIVKGAAALLARDIAVRSTIDLDVYRASSRDEAERDIRGCAGIDVGDWFSFELGRGVSVADAGRAVRLPAIARIGATEWVRFHVDIVADEAGERRMTGTPDAVPPLAPIVLPGIDRPGYRVYPLVDHVADKTCAMFERFGAGGSPSTRYKDLIDLVVLAISVQVTAEAQMKALRSEATRRSITLPERFDVPDRAPWEIGYAAEARRSRGLSARTLDGALAAVRPFLDPLLANDVVGSWDPDRARWEA